MWLVRLVMCVCGEGPRGMVGGKMVFHSVDYFVCV